MEESKDQYNSNLEIAFKYVEKIFDGTNKTLDSLNTRASAFIGFGGVLLKFAFDLPDGCNLAKNAKILAIICLWLSLLINSISLLSQSSGNVIKPQRIMNDDYFDLDPKDLKATILDTFAKAEEELDKDAQRKSVFLNLGIILIVIAALSSTIGVITVTSQEICKTVIK
ncbi:hypothetical protein H6G04_33645 [Calothrix membranacea FACHB-236]|nr:hypothetical protein [Calothrix membranacea FACHB-236]